MLFNGVILEGVVCTGKSSLLRALLAHPSFVGRSGPSSIVLTEHHTQRVLESLGPRSGLRVEDNVGLLREHADYLSGVAQRITSMTGWREDAPNPRLTAVIERFHLSHVLNYAHLDWEHVSDIDAQMAALGVRLCVVVTHPKELERRIRGDRGGDWGSFLSEPGQRDHLSQPVTDDAKVRYFVRQQEVLSGLSSRSRMPRVTVDTASLAPDAAAEIVLGTLLGHGSRKAPPNQGVEPDEGRSRSD